MSEGFTPNLIGFFCQWCSYLGADLAGTNRLCYPANIKIIRIPCTGRIDPQFILRAFLNGADGVLVSGCHPGDCHYTAGNYFARRRMQVFKDLLNFMGFDQERLIMTWISASESKKLVKVVEQFNETITRMGPQKQLVLPTR